MTVIASRAELTELFLVSANQLVEPVLRHILAALEVAMANKLASFPGLYGGGFPVGRIAERLASGGQ